jgi:aminoglycoside phosphotransferase (APT) family kinase protein
VIDEIHTLVSRRLPGCEIRSIVRLGEGSENVAYEVNGELIIRVSKNTDAVRRSESTRREANLLDVVAGFSTLPVPEPLFVDTDTGVLAYRKLPGLPLMSHPVADPTRLAPALGEFLNHLHRTPLREVRALVARETDVLSAWRDDAERNYRESAEHLPAAARCLVEDFLGQELPADSSIVAFCHNDLGAEHVLVDVEASISTGIIDWADAAITDPVLDFARLYRDLGPDFCDLMLAHYDGTWTDADRERAVFYARCLLLEDFVYGIETGERAYADEALSHLGRTFAEP